MNEQKKQGRGIFYGVIGVATLVVAIIGATFAYFTATASNNNVITGNMATITFNLKVDKSTIVDETKGGMIPMSNTMVEAAIGNGKSDSGDTPTNPICTDDNGNAVCQVYKITVTNGGTASMFLDGYVSLTGGSGEPQDFNNYTNWKPAASENPTTMRWAQAFCTEDTDGKLVDCTTAGVTTTHATGDGSTVGIDTGNPWGKIELTSDKDTTDTGLNKGQILSDKDAIVGTGAISGNNYDIIDTNYIRVSDHALGAGYKRETDSTSALVFNQLIAPKDADDTNNTGDSNSTYTDAQVYYIVVWLSENGKNQTPGQTPTGGTNPNPAAEKFFQGNVTFNSAQGSEVTATFSGYATVPSDQLDQAGA